LINEAILTGEEERGKNNPRRKHPVLGLDSDSGRGVMEV